MQQQKSHKVAFRRLRSKSFDGKNSNVEIRRRKSAKALLPAIDNPPPPVLQCKGSIVLWRAQKSCEVFLFLHEKSGIFEVVTIDRSTGVAKELNRLYIKKSDIENIVKGSHYVSYVKSQRQDLVDRALLSGCIDYIVESLDCTEKERGQSAILTQASYQDTEMRLQHYDAKTKCTSTLNVPKPVAVCPALLMPSDLMTTSTMVGASDLQQELSKGFKHISSLTSEALKNLELSSPLAVLDQITSLQGAGEKVYSQKSTNPNIYSTPRWRWIWNINQVVHRNRLTKLLGEMTMLRNKKRMIAGMSNAEYDRRRQMSVIRRQGNPCPRRTSLSEIMDMGPPSCPSFAQRTDFRKLAFKNEKITSPVFKVSVAEIYESCKMKPLSFSTQYNSKTSGCADSNSYGRKRMDSTSLPVVPVRPRYVAIHCQNSTD